MSLKWRLYYGDGSTFSNADGPPQDAPCCNVQVIVSIENGRRILQHGADNPTAHRDYYWWENDGWVIGDQAGYWQYMSEPGWKTVKFGRTIETEKFHEIIKRVLADPDFRQD